MTLDVMQTAVVIAAAALGTMLTRFLPFLAFGGNKPAPKYVQYLGKVITGAALGLLVVYCFKNVSVLSAPYALPEIISVLLIAVLHIWRRNMLLSVAGGTACYMILVNFVFI